MEILTASSFEIASCQATVFTPDGDLAVSKVMKDLYPSLATRFDGEPTILPPLPEGGPLEIPRITLESTSREWRCELSRARFDVYWRRTKSTEACVALGDFFRDAVEILRKYAAQLSPRIARLAALTTRFSPHETPGCSWLATSARINGRTHRSIAQRTSSCTPTRDSCSQVISRSTLGHGVKRESLKETGTRR